MDKVNRLLNERKHIKMREQTRDQLRGILSNSNPASGGPRDHLAKSSILAQQDSALLSRNYGKMAPLSP